MIEEAERIKNLPPYLFAQIDKTIEEKKAQGVDVISLGIGDPVDPTPAHIVEKLKKEVEKPENHRYPSYYGLKEFRQAISEWYKKRFGVCLDPDKEVLPLIGSKEGIAHISWAMVNPGEVVLVPDPAYPVYSIGAQLAGGKPYFIPLFKRNNFLLELEEVEEEVLQKARLLFLNYPNNPTSAVASLDYFEKIVQVAKEHKIIVCHDNAYSEITFEDFAAPSILQVKEAKDWCVEFHSLSKTYNMTGWRVGFLVGNQKVVEALGRIKTNIDSGIFNPIQYAAIEALSGPQDSVLKMRAKYLKRRNMVLSTLKKIGLSCFFPQATVYVWVEVPEGETSASFTQLLLDQANVVVSPGNAYGEHGEGYVRISLTVPDSRLEEALERIEKVF